MHNETTIILVQEMFETLAEKYIMNHGFISEGEIELLLTLLEAMELVD